MSYFYARVDVINGLFDLTSGGLIIDQQTEQTTINLGGDTYTGENENHETVFYLREVPLKKGATGNKKYANGQGGRAQLSATKFRLRTSNNEYLWQVSAPNAGAGLRIRDRQRIDGVRGAD